MEGDSEESDEDVQGQDKPIVVWEKCIQQSIFVDISDDESLHLSDLESSLDLHFSKADSFPSEASIHLSGKCLLFFLFCFVLGFFSTCRMAKQNIIIRYIFSDKIDFKEVLAIRVTL